MSEKNIQIKDLQGNLLYPKTKAAVVLNNDGENLGTVEAGAQVNKIETVQVNGVDLQIVDKKVNVEIPAAAEYSIVKNETAEEGFSATYSLTKDGTAVGALINIPKDMVVQSGSVKTCTTADQPVAGFKVGDKYIDLVLANAENTHIYILATDLVDVYTAGDDTIKIENHEISVDLDELKKTFQTNLSTGQLAAADSGITAAKVGEYDDHLADADIHVTAAQKTAWTAKQDALNDAQLAAVNSGITAEKVAGMAEDDKVVHLDGAETITGAKAFSAGLTNGKAIAAKDSSTQVATTAWVQKEISEMLTYEELA